MKRYVITTVTEIEVDDQGTMRIVSKDTKMQEKQMREGIVSIRHKINKSEVRYGILTFGKKGAFGNEIPLDTDIIVVFQGKKYFGHSHKETTGRIDRLRMICENFQVDEWIMAEYIIGEKKIIITRES